MKAYIITCNGHVSSLAFKKFDDAEWWVLKREDAPVKHRGWLYLAGPNTYKIHEVEID